MANNTQGSWVGYGLGDADDPRLPRTAPNWHAVTLLNQKLHDKYQWARDLGVQYGPTVTTQTARAITTLCAKTGLPIVLDKTGNAVANLGVRKRLGSYPPPPPLLPIGLSIEGHCSDMTIGPAADTADTMEAEGLCHSQYVGYTNCALPFKTQTAVEEAARLLRMTTLPLGWPFPPDLPWIFYTFSEGSIAGYELYSQYLAPGCELEWREEHRLGTLAYGNPNRKTDSIAPWARGGIETMGTHGLDPVKRFGLPGCPEQPRDFMDVYREGDIFAENDDSAAGEMKAAVYQAVARGKLFSGNISLLSEIAGIYKQPLKSVFAIFNAIVDGVSFLGHNPNPHYSPYDITGGVNWSRQKLTAAIAAMP